MPSPTASQALTAEARSLELDRQDPLASWREQFHIPLHEGKPGVYLCGNSLGLMPRAARDAVNQEMDDWAKFGVEGHFHAKHPWFPTHEFCRDTAARLVGAKSHEIVIMNSLTVNLHLMMATFYRPTKERYRIVVEDSCFPSDSYAVQSQTGFHGFDPKTAVVRLKPRAGEHTLRTDDVVGFMKEHGRDVALVLLGGVNYLTGQVMDFARITEAAQRAGAVIGWDLAHAAGNVPLKLHEWGADFACWCSYKYLNSGPGAVAGCFVHEKHTKKTGAFGSAEFLPRFAGWWGNDPKTRFVMGPDFLPVANADAWSLSNPPVMAIAPVRTSLEIFDKATMPTLRAKSEKLTAYLQELIDAIPGSEKKIEVITPREPGARGCQLSIAVKERSRDLHKALTADGVISDFREPNVIRVAPVPLYNTFHDCWRFAEILRSHVGKMHH